MIRSNTAPSVQALPMSMYDSPRYRKVIAYHLIMTTYGFWLPNDPRGSGSCEVRAKHLQRFGPATRIDSKRSVAHVAHDRALRIEAKKNLRFPPVRFTGRQATAVARGFQTYVRKSKLIVYACTILPTHVHLLIARHALAIERIAILLKGAASAQLLTEGLHPFGHLQLNRVPTPWTRNERNIFLNNLEAIHRSARYADTNAIRERFKVQRWPFLSPLPSA